MKKRHIIWIILIATGLILLAACNSEENGTTPTPEMTPSPALTRTPRPTRTPTPTLEITSEPPATPLPTENPELDLRGVTVKFWHPWTNDKEYAILSLVNEFNASNPDGIVVTAFSQGSNTYKNVSAVLGSSAAPQVVVGYNNQLQSWDNLSGSLINLDDYLNDPAWGIETAQQADFYPVIWAQDSNDTKRLGLPVYRSAIVIFYNQSWAQELGFDAAPQTPDDLREQACAAAAANHDSTGGWIATTDISTNMSWLMAFNGGLLHPNGFQYQAVSAENQAAFEYLRNLFDLGCAWVPGAYYPNQEFATRKGLFLPSTVAGIPFQKYAFEDANNRDQWTVIPFPDEDGQPVINLYGSAYALLKSSPEQQLASWLFIKWLLQPENQARFIEASGYLPVSAAALDYLDDYIAENPLWAQVIDWIPYGQTEPALGSWGVARWAFGDAIDELFSPEYPSAQIPALLEKLEGTLNEINVNNP